MVSSRREEDFNSFEGEDLSDNRDRSRRIRNLSDQAERYHFQRSRSEANTGQSDPVPNAEDEDVQSNFTESTFFAESLNKLDSESPSNYDTRTLNQFGRSSTRSNNFQDVKPNSDKHKHFINITTRELSSTSTTDDFHFSNTRKPRSFMKKVNKLFHKSKEATSELDSESIAIDTDTLYGTSLKIFSSSNPFRIKTATILRSRTYDYFMRFLLISQTGLLAYRQWNPRALQGYVMFGFGWADWILVVLNICYTLDEILNIIAWGLWDDSQLFEKYNWHYDSIYEIFGLNRLKEYFWNDKESLIPYEFQRTYKKSNNSKVKRAYLRKTWHRINVTSTISFWISFALSLQRLDVDQGVPLFRALSCLRIFRITTFVSGISVILQTIKLCLPQLGDVMLLLLYFWLLFAIIGVQTFKSSLRRFCVWTNPNDPTDLFTTDQYCGGYYDMVNGTLAKLPYLKANDIPANSAKGFICPLNSKCMTLENASGNTYGFDNILSSMQMTFVVMSGNTFSNVMYDTIETDSMVASIFFILGIFILLLWMINLLIAVISESFRLVANPDAGNENFNEQGDFKLDWNFPDTKYSRAYLRFKLIFEGLVLISILLLCLNDMETPFDTYKKRTDYQSIISLFLLFEIFIRMGLYSVKDWKTFFTLKRNNLDLIIAIITSVISIPSLNKDAPDLYVWLSFFFLVRFYRLLIAAKVTRKLWSKVWKNITIILNLSLFYMLILFLTSIIFARYFEGFAGEEDIEEMRYPFHTLPNVVIALFTITSTENWSDVMFSLNDILANKSEIFFSVVFFIMWFIISHTIILSIFIAIITSSVNFSEIKKRKKQVKHFILNEFSQILERSGAEKDLDNFRSELALNEGSSESSIPKVNDKHQSVLNLLLDGAAVKTFLENEIDNSKPVESILDEAEDIEDAEKHKKSEKNTKFDYLKQFRFDSGLSKYKTRFLKSTFWKYLKNNPFHTEDKGSKTMLKGEKDSDFISMANTYRLVSEKTNQIREEFLKENPNFNRSLLVFHPSHPIRRFCQRIVSSSHGKRYHGVDPNRIVSLTFTITIFVATVFLIIIACYNTPLQRKTNVKEGWDWMVYIELVIALLFTFEFALKVVADGLVLTPNGYLKSIWNIIDLIVLGPIWVNFIAISNDYRNVSGGVSCLMAFRALRLLTISSNSKSIFQNVMLTGFGKIIGAAALAISLLFPFAVWGLNLFRGKLGVCNDGVLGRDDCFNEYSNEVFKWEILSPRAYEEPQMQFNYFEFAMLTIFEVLSLEGWTDLLSNLMASTGVGTPAKTYSAPQNAIFLVFFVFIGLVVIHTLFVSVIISNYAAITGRAYLTLEQSSWMKVNDLLKGTKPSKRPVRLNLSKFKTFCFRFVVQENRYVTGGFRLLLWFHVLTLFLEKYPSNDYLVGFRIFSSFVTSSLFLIYTTMRLIALGPKIFFHRFWDVYDFIVFFCAFGSSFLLIFISRNNTFNNINKLFLVGIYAVVIRTNNRLNQLLKIATASVFSLLSLIFTWFVLFLFYAIALNQIFGLTRLGPNTTAWMNFRTVPNALIVLFKNSFGEGWNYTMNDFGIEEPFCSDSSDVESNDCGNMQVAYIFFITWNVISMYIFVNMFTSLIFESFSYVYANKSNTTFLNSDEIKKFKIAWQKFDPLGTGIIKPEELTLFLRSLEGYFAFTVFDGDYDINKMTNRFKKYPDYIPRSPYEILLDMKSLKKHLDKMDLPAVKEKQALYEAFVEECLISMEVSGKSGISFTELILLLPLYTKFDEGKCLLLTNYLDRQILWNKINQRMKKNHTTSTIKMILPRWRFLKLKNPGKVLEFKANKTLSPALYKRYSYRDGDIVNNDLGIDDKFLSPFARRSFTLHRDDVGDYGDLSITEIAEALEVSQWGHEIRSADLELKEHFRSMNDNKDWDFK